MYFHLHCIVVQPMGERQFSERLFSAFNPGEVLYRCNLFSNCSVILDPGNIGAYIILENC